MVGGMVVAGRGPESKRVLQAGGMHVSLFNAPSFPAHGRRTARPYPEHPAISPTSDHIGSPAPDTADDLLIPRGNLLIPG